MRLRMRESSDCNDSMELVGVDLHPRGNMDGDDELTDCRGQMAWLS